MEAKWGLGKRDPILGSPLTIELPRDTNAVAIKYETSPQASGLQWLEPAQTADKRQPFLYSQNESIHARSWIPIQDSSWSPDDLLRPHPCAAKAVWH